MGIEAEFGSGKITAAVATFQKSLEAATVFVMQALGEDLVKYAREKHNYTDQTGNLTNSMGYVIARKRTPVFYGGFQPGDGKDAGLKVAMEMAAKAGSDFSLIIVAGMDYSAYVEAKGYNVILPAELKAKKDFPEAMRKLTKKAQAKAQEIYGKL